MNIDPTRMPQYVREDGTAFSAYGLYRKSNAGLWDVAYTEDRTAARVTDTRTGASFTLVRRSATDVE